MIRLAIRTLSKAPSFTAIAVLTIALGIAANTAMFSVINAVLLRPLPFPDEARLVRVLTSTPSESSGSHSAGEFLDLRRSATSLAALAGYRTEIVSVAPDRGDAQQVEADEVTPEFFDVLGTRPALGRVFTRAQDAAGGERLAVLSHTLWQQAFGGDAAIAGRRVRINGVPYTIAGVMPPGFSWPSSARLWLMSAHDVPSSPVDVKGIDPLTDRDVRYFDAIARLAPGVTLDRAASELHAIAARFQRTYPSSDGERDIRLTTVREDLTGDVRPALLVLQGAVGLVLLIACANVSSLLIARATNRRRELAIRAALGASRASLVRQVLAESVLLGAAGGLVGLLGGGWLLSALVRLLPAGVPRADGVSIDATVAAVTILASLLTGIVFGVLPAWQASHADPVTVIKAAGDRGGSARPRGRSLLVVAQVAVTFVLLAGASLLGASFMRLQQVDSGFRPDHVTNAYLFLPHARYPKAADQTRAFERLLEALSARPELQAVGIGFPGPFHGSSASGSFSIEGRPSATRADKPFANIGSVSGGYFAAMGVPLLSGRTFAPSDVESAPPVAIVNTAFAKKYWPGEVPIGKRLRFDDTPDEPWFTVVGLVGDVRQLGLSQAPPPILYVPFAQFPIPFTAVTVRSALSERDVVALLRTELAAIDRDLAFGGVETMEAVLARSVAQPRFRTLLLGIFAGLAIALAAIGMYGLISYSVAQRTREIGIRVALGAQPGQLLGSILREGARLAAIGIVAGLAGAVALRRVLSAFLFGIGATNPVVLGSAALFLLLVVVAATYVPSRRALRVDPLVALRAE